MADQTVYDVIIVGAGPGGSSAATFLARHGLSVLLIDKARFPRDKVCGDGLTPQTLYWLDVLGCVNEVLSETSSCITSADVYVDGERVMTGRFPQDTPYPGFCTLLERRKLDYIILNNAVANGCQFKAKHLVRKVEWLADGIVVEAESENGTVRFKGRLLIGADGGNSVVSRVIGNVPRDGTTAVSLRTYYQGVRVEGSQMKLFFDREFFPGYGWVFVDDNGKANIGLGYASDNNFPAKRDLKSALNAFIQSDLKGMLKGATPIGRPAGWWLCFSRAKTTVVDRVMLVGDAANLADPMNGGGIHKAIESAHMAAQVAIQAIASGDCSKQALSLYEKLWRDRSELDWRTGDLVLSIAKNPNLREFYLLFLKNVGRMSERGRRFQDFCTSFFTEVAPRGASVSPLALLNVIPVDPRIWLSILRPAAEAGSYKRLDPAVSATRSALSVTGRVAASPFENAYWGMEVLEKMLGFAECYANRQAISTIEFTRGALSNVAKF